MSSNDWLKRYEAEENILTVHVHNVVEFCFDCFMKDRRRPNLAEAEKIVKDVVEVMLEDLWDVR